MQEGDFAKAWQLATAHRVDLNLLVDYGWPKFLLQAESFIDQVSDDQDIVDLLSALREKSVVEEGGLYSGLPPANPTAHLEQVGQTCPGSAKGLCIFFRSLRSDNLNLVGEISRHLQPCSRASANLLIEKMGTCSEKQLREI